MNKCFIVLSLYDCFHIYLLCGDKCLDVDHFVIISEISGCEYLKSEILDPEEHCCVNHFEEHFSSLNAFDTLSCQKSQSITAYSSLMIYANFLLFENVNNCFWSLY